MNSLLEDDTFTYLIQNKDPTVRLQKRNNDLVQMLEDEEIISKKIEIPITFNSIYMS